MLSIKYIRENPEVVQAAISNKGEKGDVHEILRLDKKIRQLIQDVEAKKAEKNRTNSQIVEAKRNDRDADQLIKKMKKLSAEIKMGDSDLSQSRQQLNELLIWVPNIPHRSVPIGVDESTNVEVRVWGEAPAFDFEIKTHLDLGTSLHLFDFERAAKISGSGFPLFTGKGAKLERGLINFMLDYHVQRGYKEVYTPFMTLPAANEATGQLPKLKEDMYFVERDNLYLIPTAEVPVTNIHRGEILSEDELPIHYVAFSPCFRREAGSYGKETRGLLRVHQFNKVELVKFVKPETSYQELERLTRNAESILQVLGLHYRVVALSTGELSFAAAKCYDLEVWAPGENRWLEVSSCSNYESFQARRANIRYRRKDGKLEFVHTLNGSALATPRLTIALLETYQTDEGTVMVPKILQPYVGETVLK